MKSRVLIALLTVLVFGAGYFARWWADCHQCQVPPAPALLGELSSRKATPVFNSPDPLPNPAKVAAALARLGPEIEKFRARMGEIDAEMDRETLALLRPEQLPLWDKMIKHRAEYRAMEEAGAAGDGLLTSEQIMNLQQRPLYKLLAVVVVPQKLHWLANDLNLDAAQREKARQILLVRREKFLALVDSSPPPSLTLSRLAPLAPRLGEPKK